MPQPLGVLIGIERQRQRQPASQPASQPARQAGRQTDRQTDRHIDRQRQRQRHAHGWQCRWELFVHRVAIPIPFEEYMHVEPVHAAAAAAAAAAAVAAAAAGAGRACLRDRDRVQQSFIQWSFSLSVVVGQSSCFRAVCVSRCRKILFSSTSALSATCESNARTRSVRASMPQQAGHGMKI